MRKVAIYVETSVWSHALADDAPESRTATLDFLGAAEALGYELHVSEIVLTEISRAPEDVARKLQALLQEHHPATLDFDEEADRLAQEFLRFGVVPLAKIEDAQHVAVAVVNELDILASWNYRHLVNVRKREAFRHVSAMNGYYKPLHIVTPLEVGDETQ
jgi:predicted nucleic acid-binding protein